MKFYRITLLFVGVITLGSTGSASDSVVDHLQPVSLNEFVSYRRILRSKLYVTPANCGRVVARQSFAPEESVSVYFLSVHGKRDYRITYTLASVNLWQQTDVGRDPKRAESVKIQRIDANIDPRIGDMLCDLWPRMLSGSQRARPTPAPSRTMIPTEGTIDEFSVETPGGSKLYGELDVSIPPPGNRTKKLVELSGLLKDYCKTETANRRGIAAKIELKVRSLLSDLQ